MSHLSQFIRPCGYFKNSIVHTFFAIWKILIKFMECRAKPLSGNASFFYSICITNLFLVGKNAKIVQFLWDWTSGWTHAYLFDRVWFLFKKLEKKYPKLNASFLFSDCLAQCGTFFSIYLNRIFFPIFSFWTATEIISPQVSTKKGKSTWHVMSAELF